MHDHWLADRTKATEESGIRKIFDLASQLENPVNLSIGQPDFDVPEPIKQAAKAAIDRGDNGYTVTQGIPPLRAKIEEHIQSKYDHADRALLVTTGTSGGLALSLFCTVNPGDEVIFFDPYFVMYPHFVALAGGKPIYIDTYPNFAIDVNKVREALSTRTKAIIVNSPGNPTGVVASRDSLRELAILAKEKDILLISDEVYRTFCFDEPFCSPAEFNDETLVLDGFSKAYGMTGWRLGFAHGPSQLIAEMTKMQQFTFVCATSVVQHAGVVAWDVDVTPYTQAYKKKRDRIYNGLRDRFDCVKPGGAFYMFVKAPWGTATEFVTEAIQNNLLIIPGKAFSQRDTHFRISFAATDETLDAGLEILNRIAKK